MKAGEKLAVRVRGSRASGGSSHDSGAVAAFYAPGRDPEHDPGDRDPDWLAPLDFDPVTRLYEADVSTLGWVPGSWTCRGTVLSPDGVPEGWDWCSFPLDP